MVVEPVPEIARMVSGRLSELDGVEAIVLGGSLARGEAFPDSDIDLGVYYRDANRPEVEELRLLARDLGLRDPDQPATDFGGWGPWINGGAWLLVGERPVDWLYREIGRVTGVVEQCRSGRPDIHYQVGHPHGFYTHIYLGEIFYCTPLYDPNETMRDLKRMVEEYPQPLREALLRKQLWEARFALETCRKSAARGDAFYVSGCLFRSAACMTQALFALNGRYLVNEKGAVAASYSLPLRPPDFAGTVVSVLAGIGGSPEGLISSVRRFEALLEAVEKTCFGL